MQFQFSQYQYQTDAADAVCDVFDGQPLQDGVSYIRDVGIRKPVFPDPEPIQDTLFEDNRPKQATFNSYDEDDDTGYRNADLLLTYERLLANVKNVQRRQNLEESPKLYADPAGAVELDVEMETGTGKTVRVHEDHVRAEPPVRLVEVHRRGTVHRHPRGRRQIIGHDQRLFLHVRSRRQRGIREEAALLHLRFVESDQTG